MAAGTAAELPPVAQVTGRLQALLEKARNVKSECTVEPPLPASEVAQDVDAILRDIDGRYEQLYAFNVTETAARQLFYRLVNSAQIEDPAFVEVWNLLDILIICGDNGKCGPELVCHLIEELLDSQTTAGCRIVFDYLESRTARLASKDFHKKNLTFLRACNELLRRLSRAEDAIFCGRVFFFLFQTFPLGDKSSVNLRGEFHVENTTKFEVPEQEGEKMDVDGETTRVQESTPASKSGTPQPPTKSDHKAKAAKKAPEEVVLSNNELYPIFWRLQQDFSDPTRLFAPDHFASFKKGLVNTLTKFKKTPTVVQTKADADTKHGLKRKLGANGTDGEAPDHFVDNYNPKYLTSRDLFDLEIADLAFQRHIMVQAWILIDFLLSLTEKAKKKLSAAPEATNKSLLYTYTLSAEDAKWCTDARATITDSLQAIPTTQAGRFYHRMVETILARDKNWVRWKVESCPSIVRDPVPAELEMDARSGAKNATRVRRIPDRPPGAIDLSFLEEEAGGGLEALKDPARFTEPSVEELVDGIRGDRLDLEMAMDDGERASLENAISNKTWRVLRQVRASNVSLLNKVDPSQNVEEVLRPPPTPPPESDAKLELAMTPEPVEAPKGDGAEPAESDRVHPSTPAVKVTSGDDAHQGADEADG